MSDYPRDEYYRALIPDRQVPPADVGWAVWRGKVVEPDSPNGGNTAVVLEREHGKLCVGGWIPSGDWWLHCSRCREWEPSHA